MLPDSNKMMMITSSAAVERLFSVASQVSRARRCLSCLMKLWTTLVFLQSRQKQMIS